MISLPSDDAGIHRAVMALTEPCHVMICEVDGNTIPNCFLKDCRYLVGFEMSGTALHTIGRHFLDGCTSLACFDTSGMTAITTVGL